jgi:2-C-methyl-D-erythritol 4-phosphate cytidylyltransferase
MAYHLIIPAAGSGQRFGGAVPKQYLALCGVPLIERTLRQLTELMTFDSVSIGLAPGDYGWKSARQYRSVQGADSRAATVLALLESLDGIAGARDWVWVQDAVRPFVSAALLERLLSELEQGADSVVAGLPVTDTLKQVDARQLVTATPDRSAVWIAQTPQVCRYGLLLEALRRTQSEGWEVTDEAMAMELCGHAVKMVLGDEDNIKITRPGDLSLAEFIYAKRQG